MWTNATFINVLLGGVLIHKHCPFDYCKADSFNLNLEDPDEQCAFNCSGILCGACQPTSVMSLENLHVESAQVCEPCFGFQSLP